MNLLTHLKQTNLPLLVTIVLACFWPLPQAQAVSPAPDGCYPNFTTTEGCDALFSLTIGAGNTALGWRSLFLDSTGSFNTGVGGGALVLNNGDSNTAVGAAALLLNTSGTQNVAIGTDALVYNDGGNYNNAVGAFALMNNTDGLLNNAFGNAALAGNIHGVNNTAVGDSALANNDAAGTGLANDNTAVGAMALFSNTDGSSNTAAGLQALFNNTTGIDNTATGYQALFHNTNVGGDYGGENTADGASALFNNTIGFFNTGTGSGALFNNVTGNDNTACGAGALVSSTIGNDNTAVGFQAGLSATGDGNVYIGAGIMGVAGESSHTYIRNINSTSVSGAGTDTVTVDLTTGLLGHATSSRRYKEDIKPMSSASEALYRLHPVTYRYKKEIDRSQSAAFGLIAEEVASVNPNLVARNSQGQPESIHYEMVNAMLLNEFLKEHRTVEELKKEIAALTATVKEQASEIQKVSARLEASKSLPQIVLNSQ
jgi:hypothetical protein